MHRLDVVDPENASPSLEREHVGRDRPRQPLADRASRQPAEERLTGGADHDRPPDRNDLVAIITDETRRNPQTVMPPFGRNRILTEQEINAVVDFLQTL